MTRTAKRIAEFRFGEGRRWFWDSPRRCLEDTRAVREIRDRRQRPAERVANAANHPGVDRSRVHLALEVGEEPSDLGGGSDWGAGDRDAGAKRERALRRLEDAVARQAIQRQPVHGIRRAVVLPHHNDRVRVLVLDALDAPFSRDALAPVVDKRVAVMGEHRGRGCEIERHRESCKASFHTFNVATLCYRSITSRLSGAMRSSARARSSCRRCYSAALFSVRAWSIHADHASTTAMRMTLKTARKNRLGGAGPRRLASHNAVRIEIISQNPYTPPRPRGRVARTYTAIAANHNTPSTSSVDTRDFSSPQ